MERKKNWYRKEIDEVKEFSNERLLEQYNCIRNQIDGITEGGYGKFELNYLEELVREMSLREGR